MKRRSLGTLDVSAIGLGCMSMTPIYGKPDRDEAVATIHRALDLGIDLIDTADTYGDGANEDLVGRALADRRNHALIATKFGNLRLPDGTAGVNGRPDYVRKACEASLRRLGVETIDLYYVHRIDPGVPIEDTVGTMADLKTEGKIRHLGLSEAAPETLKRAHATHPISALQTEYSLWTRDAEADLLEHCRELGIGYVAYSPLGRGFLTATIPDLDALEANDRRRDHPRFEAGNLAKNVALLDALESHAEAIGCRPAQLALAWVLSRGEHIVPIPGTRRRKWLEENAQAVELTVSDDILDALSATFRPGVAAGDRYPAGQMKRVRI